MQTQRHRIWVFVIVAALVGALTGYLVGAKAPSRIEKDAWDIASALGTVSAVLVASAVGAYTFWPQRLERQARARITACLLFETVRLFGLRLSVLESRHEYNESVPGAGLPLGFESLFEDPLLSASADDLLTIHHVSVEAATNLAFALAIVRELKRAVAEAAAYEAHDPSAVSEAERHEALLDWLAMVGRARTRAFAALDHLRGLLDDIDEPWPSAGRPVSTNPYDTPASGGA